MAPEKTVKAKDVAATIAAASQLLSAAVTALAANPDAEFKLSDDQVNALTIAVGKRCPPCPRT